MEITRKDDLVSLKTDSGVVTANASSLSVNDFSTDWPGEYEVEGVSFRILDIDGKLCHRVYADETRVFLVDGISREVSEEEIEIIGDLNAVVLNADESELSAKSWKVFLEEVNPQVVVFLGNGEKTDALKKELGAQEVKSVDSLKISSSLSDKTDYYFLES